MDRYRGKPYWYMHLVREPNNSMWVLGACNRDIGSRIWASGAWMCPIDPMTQAEVLDEFWWAVLEARGENFKR